MHDAHDLIFKALDEANPIQPAGRQSLLALAARALDPAAPATRDGIARTLGMHPSLLIAVMVCADLAQDTPSRRDLGRTVLGPLSLGHRPPELTEKGQLAVGAFCLERFDLLAHLLGDLWPLLRPLLDAWRSEAPVEALTLKEVAEAAQELQRVRVIRREEGSKSKLGVPEAEAARRRAAQAVRAYVEGLRDGGKSPHLSSTVAGEVAGALVMGRGLDEGAGFCLDLARFLDGLPEALARRLPRN